MLFIFKILVVHLDWIWILLNKMQWMRKFDLWNSKVKLLRKEDKGWFFKNVNVLHTRKGQKITHFLGIGTLESVGLLPSCQHFSFVSKRMTHRGLILHLCAWNHKVPLTSKQAGGICPSSPAYVPSSDYSCEMYCLATVLFIFQSSFFVSPFKLFIFIGVQPISKQCRTSFQWAAKGLSRAYTCTHSPSDSPPLQAGTWREAEFLCPAAGPRWVPILKTATCACPYQTPHLPRSPSFPQAAASLVLEVHEPVSVSQVHFVSFLLLDSTYEGCHAIFFLLCLTHFTQHDIL